MKEKKLWRKLCIFLTAILIAGTISVTALAAEITDDEVQDLEISESEEKEEVSEETQVNEELDDVNIAVNEDVAMEQTQEESLTIIEGIKENLPSEINFNKEGKGVSNYTISTYSSWVSGRWVSSGGYWYFLQLDGQYVKDSTLTINGRVYYFDGFGRMATNWKKIDDAWYFFGTDGVMRYGWQYIGNIWYYFHDEGTISEGKGIMYSAEIFQETKGCMVIDGKLYRFQNSGALYVGWYKTDAKYVYFSINGAVQSGWKKIGGVYYYFVDYDLVKSGFKTIGTTTYYLDPSNGAMAVGWKKVADVWYYFNASGAQEKNGWSFIGDSWYYLDTTTGAMKTGWLT
ncbi:hypothetical protein NE598_20705, partial [[Clostridium] scindens]|nr:hypothetical protein [[Clostridium] scindens]MCB7194937.1 hypothetical protein [[Clostridium] scindens]MCB7288136.1 hypothetical protein [[Clostridium] scindens]MCQ5289757.1 hypothetical protein [[Clostridium] scindens]